MSQIHVDEYGVVWEWIGGEWQFRWYCRGRPGVDFQEGRDTVSDVRTIQAHEASDKYVAKLQRELAQTKEALAMSLRQWSAYYRDDESNDLETAKHAEADNYRWCMAALKKGETQ